MGVRSRSREAYGAPLDRSRVDAGGVDTIAVEARHDPWQRPLRWTGQAMPMLTSVPRGSTVRKNARSAGDYYVAASRIEPNLTLTRMARPVLCFSSMTLFFRRFIGALCTRHRRDSDEIEADRQSATQSVVVQWGAAAWRRGRRDGPRLRRACRASPPARSRYSAVG